MGVIPCSDAFGVALIFERYNKKLESRRRESEKKLSIASRGKYTQLKDDDAYSKVSDAEKGPDLDQSQTGRLGSINIMNINQVVKTEPADLGQSKSLIDTSRSPDPAESDG